MIEMEREYKTMKNQLSLLTAEIQRVSAENKSQREALAAHDKNAAALKDKEALFEKVTATNFSMKQLLQELEDTKQELFFNMAIAIKLNLLQRGEHPRNRNIAELYDRLKLDKIDRKNWNRWLHNQFENS